MSHDSRKDIMKMTLEEILSSSPDSVRRLAGEKFSVYVLGARGSDTYRKAFDNVLKVRTEPIVPGKVEVCTQLGDAYLYEYVDQ